MRRYVIGIMAGLVCGWTAGAQAQTLAQTRAPAAIDWSGFYVGGFLGGTNSQAQVQTTAGSGPYLNATDDAQINRAANSDLEQWRPAGGLVGGYGRQFGNIVVGIEASANTLLLNDERTVSEIYQSTGTSRFTLKQSVTADWMATLRPRLGWAEDNWLGYVTGGLSVTRLKLDTTFADTAFSARSQSSDSQMVTGWSLGLGGEYALGRDWSLRGEYLYTRFNQMRSSSGVTATGTTDTDSLNHSADLGTHGVMVGLTYRFKGF